MRLPLNRFFRLYSQISEIELWKKGEDSGGIENEMRRLLKGKK